MFSFSHFTFPVSIQKKRENSSFINQKVCSGILTRSWPSVNPDLKILIGNVFQLLQDKTNKQINGKMYETVCKTICKFAKDFIFRSTVFPKKHIQLKCRRLVNDENWSRNLYLVKVLAPFFCWGVEFFFTLQGFIKIYFWINLSYQWQKYAIREIFPASGNLGSWVV